MHGPTSDSKQVAVRVWDRPTRVFHWCLVACLAGSWITAEQGSQAWHERFGLTALTLIAFRLVWGVVGGEFARFASFVRGPKTIASYIRETAAGRHPTYVGHNPLGALAVLALLVLVGTQATLGLFATDDILYEGPLYSLVSYETSTTLTGWHHRLFNVILAVVALHILAVLAYGLLLGNDLIQPMITGRKYLPESTAPKAVGRTAWWIAGAIFALCAAGAYGLTLVG